MSTDFIESVLRGYNDPEKYYPGSNMKREVNHAPEEDIVDWPKGRILTVKGREVECFTTGQLAALLGGRSAVTIRSWEGEGILPKSGYALPGRDGDVRGRRRYYTKNQVQGVLDIALEEGVFWPGPRINVRRTAFTARVEAYFRELRTRGIL
jgi:hypothetical protein